MVEVTKHRSRTGMKVKLAGQARRGQQTREESSDQRLLSARSEGVSATRLRLAGGEDLALKRPEFEVTTKTRYTTGTAPWMPEA